MPAHRAVAAATGKRARRASSTVTAHGDASPVPRKRPRGGASGPQRGAKSAAKSGAKSAAARGGKPSGTTTAGAGGGGRKAVKREAATSGAVKREAATSGAVKHEAAKRGAVKREAAKRGAVKREAGAGEKGDAVEVQAVDAARVRLLVNGEALEHGEEVGLPIGDGRKVVYWMSRDQRVQDNWALLHAQQRAVEAGAPLCVVFALVPGFLGATRRHYGFMLRGLAQVQAALHQHGIEFALLEGPAPEVVPRFVKDHNVGLLVTDYSPIRIGRQWREDISRALAQAADADADADACIMEEVDAHNIVPVWQATTKIEYAARTIRPRITRQLPRFLTPFPPLLARHPHPWTLPAAATTTTTTTTTSNNNGNGSHAGCANEGGDERKEGQETKPGAGAAPVLPVPDWAAVWRGLKVDDTVGEVRWAAPGEAAAALQLHRFLATGLRVYKDKNNDPNMGDTAQSNLSPYIHFGQLAAQRAALEAHAAQRRDPRLREGVAAFLEQLIVRRELTDNYCHFNRDGYDRLDGLFPQFGNQSWAQKTLKDHAADPRDYTYTYAQLEAAHTHDELWNAAQAEMVATGKMHGFMRMYWAKKILEWTPDPDTALRFAIRLNDRFELDGRDPNGYVGCAWAIGGVHDQGWRERPVFGKIRYMNDKGCKRKFNVAQYIRTCKQKAKAAREAKPLPPLE